MVQPNQEIKLRSTGHGPSGDAEHQKLHGRAEPVTDVQWIYHPPTTAPRDSLNLNESIQNS